MFKWAVLESICSSTYLLLLSLLLTLLLQLLLLGLSQDTTTIGIISGGSRLGLLSRLLVLLATLALLLWHGELIVNIGLGGCLSRGLFDNRLRSRLRLGNALLLALLFVLAQSSHQSTSTTLVIVVGVTISTVGIDSGRGNALAQLGLPVVLLVLLVSLLLGRHLGGWLIG